MDDNSDGGIIPQELRDRLIRLTRDYKKLLDEGKIRQLDETV